MAYYHLQKELSNLQKTGVEGVSVKLVSDNNFFQWLVTIFGAPDTLFEGGYFKLQMDFPTSYPYEPPQLRFLTPVWHPNVYANGSVCISILHSATSDETLGEDPSEQWNPARGVATVLLSVISLLSQPNISSPANVDASVMYRKWRDSNGRDTAYEERVRELVRNSQLDAARDNVQVPKTIEEYLATGRRSDVRPTIITSDSEWTLMMTDSGEESDEVDEVDDEADVDNGNDTETSDHDG